MFGLDVGPSNQEQGQYNQLSNASSFATNAGEGDVTAGTTFMKNLLSGDASTISQTLAPQISAEKKGLQQDQKTSTIMGNRSGGTTAGNAAATDKVHSDITSLVGNLTGGAASGLTSVGGNLLSSGISGTEAAFGDAKQMQAQRASMWNDIFKSGASVAAGVVGGLPAGPGSWEDATSNVLGG
jgi:hypothetical protein